MSFEQRVANIKALPLRERSREQIEHAVRVLDQISYHNASDQPGTGEWRQADAMLHELCEWFVKNRWSYGEIKYLLEQGGPFLCDPYSVFHRFVAILYKEIPDARN